MAKLGFFNVTIGSGNVVTESRDVRDFDRVSLSGSGSIFLTQTGEESLTIEAEDNVLPLLTSDVQGGELKLGFLNHIGTVTTNAPIRYYLTVKNLHGLTISGAGKVEMSTLATDALGVTISGSGSIQAPALTAEALEIRISGSGKITASPLQADTLTVAISGTGHAILSGKATRQEISIPGAGAYDAAELVSDAARVRVSGAGSATVNARETLDARISGIGSIRYAGQPQVTKSISGLGSIRPLDA
jgi:hypothetical protein